MVERFIASVELILPILAGRNYEIGYFDPGWKYYGDQKKNAAAGKHYLCSRFEELAVLPVREIFAPSAAIFCWVTGPLLQKQLNTIALWGFHYRGIAYVWVKTRKDGEIISGQGIRPTFTKPTTEFLSVWTTTSRGRALPLLSERQPQVVLHPRGEHSEKPSVFRELIVELLGDRKRIELWARKTGEGWSAVGTELETD